MSTALDRSTRLPFWCSLLIVYSLLNLISPGDAYAQSALTSGLSWEFIGPQPMHKEQANFFPGVINGPMFDATGRVTAIAVDPNKSGQLFAGTAAGGVWKSTDGGTTFIPIADSINPSQPTLAIGSIATDSRTSPTILYVGTGEGDRFDSMYGEGIYRSTDSGGTWTKLGGSTLDRQSIRKIALDVSQNPASIYTAVSNARTTSRAVTNIIESAFSKDGLYRSADGENTFTQYPASTFGGCTDPARLVRRARLTM